VEGFEDAIAECINYPPEVASKICDVEVRDIYKLAELYAFSKKLISFWCQGLNESSLGTYANLTLINLHLETVYRWLASFIVIYTIMNLKS